MFKISNEPLDPAALKVALTDRRAGACVTFEGWVRDHNDGRLVLSLEYEAFNTLAEKEGSRLVDETLAKFPILQAACVHRVGHLQLGELAVCVGVAAAHRGPAFEACRFLIDELKARLPIWKKEHYATGSSEWINCATLGDFAGLKR